MDFFFIRNPKISSSKLLYTFFSVTQSSFARRRRKKMKAKFIFYRSKYLSTVASILQISCGEGKIESYSDDAKLWKVKESDVHVRYNLMQFKSSQKKRKEKKSFEQNNSLEKLKIKIKIKLFRLKVAYCRWKVFR